MSPIISLFVKNGNRHEAELECGIKSGVKSGIKRKMREIPQILRETRTIAIVGLSANPARPSYGVAQYLMPHFQIIPVNPQYSEVLGLKCYPDLASVPGKIDMVNLFQRSENVMPFVMPSISLNITCFWMQQGIWQAEARSALEAVGIDVVENKCTKIEHARLV